MYENDKNYIVGFIYKRHIMSPKEFTELMLNLSFKISKEKNAILQGTLI